MTPKASPRRKLIPKLLLIFFGIAIGVTVAELALRIVGYSFPSFYTPDQTRGYSLRPGAEGWYRKEGGSYVRINSDGLRDQEHSIAKPPNTFRIALLGDSYAEALPVSLEQSFWFVMKNKLNECSASNGKSIEVINFGVSGYGTAQELLTLREKVWKYSPDVVMLAITTNNDISDNLRALKFTDEIPYFVEQNDQLILDNSFQQTRAFTLRQSFFSRLGRWLQQHSRVAQAIIEGHRGLKVMLATWRARRSQAPPGPASRNEKTAPVPDIELGVDNLIYRTPDNEVWMKAWSVTEHLIKEMSDEVAAHNAKFIVLTLSNGPQVWPEPSVREELRKHFGSEDILYPDKRILNFCQRQNIRIISLAPELQQYADNNHVFLHGFGKNTGDGHWNVLGNQVAGELIAKKICEGALLK